MLMRSTDHGHTWTGPWITFEGLPYDNMDICADADGLHLLLVEFYEDEEAEYKWLYYAKSVDGGDTFSDPVQVGRRENIEAIKLFTSPGYIFIYAQNMDWETEEQYNYLYVSEDVGVPSAATGPPRESGIARARTPAIRGRRPWESRRARVLTPSSRRSPPTTTRSTSPGRMTAVGTSTSCIPGAPTAEGPGARTYN